MVVHSDLAYPEGVAAAEILKVGSASGSKGGESSGIREIASGGFVAGLVALFTNAFQVLVKSFRSGCMSGAAYTQMPLGYSTALVGLLAIFYAFVSPEQLPAGETLTFTVVGVGVAVLMGFFVAAACAYMAGLVGTSSSPISGIGILAIIVASLVMYALCESFGIFALPGGEKFATATAIFTTSIIMAIAIITRCSMPPLH